MDNSKIKIQAGLFRAAIERSQGKLRAISLKHFPHGACGDVTDMLGMFLNQTLGIDVGYVSGWHGDQSHAWLEHKTMIIDITADQFEGNEPMIVTESSVWHQRFGIEIRRTPGINGACGGHKTDLAHDYRLLVAAARVQSTETPQ